MMAAATTGESESRQQEFSSAMGKFREYLKAHKIAGFPDTYELLLEAHLCSQALYTHFVAWMETATYKKGESKESYKTDTIISYNRCMLITAKRKIENGRAAERAVQDLLLRA